MKVIEKKIFTTEKESLKHISQIKMKTKKINTKVNIQEIIKKEKCMELEYLLTIMEVHIRETENKGKCMTMVFLHKIVIIKIQNKNSKMIQ